MKNCDSISWLSKSWQLAFALVLFALSATHAEDVDTITFQNVDTVVIQAAPAAAVAPANVAIKVEEATDAKPANKKANQKLTVKAALDAPIWYPMLYPNPLAFNITWTAISRRTFIDARVLANQRKAKARRLQVAAQIQPAAAAQNGIEPQMRKLLEPMLTAELSFVARAADLNRDERHKLSAEGKAWFDKFLVDFIKKQDPNRQQMLLQGMQGVWFGNQQQKAESPRDALRVGVAKLVKDTLPKEKAAAYADECRHRDDFARQTSVDNLVERIDEKIMLSPDQWTKITKSLNEHWDKSRDPQLEAFAMSGSMWPGAPDQWVLPELSLAQQAVMKRVNAMSGQMFINGGIFGQMFGGEVQVFNDMDDDSDAEAAKPAAAASIQKSEAE